MKSGNKKPAETQCDIRNHVLSVAFAVIVVLPVLAGQARSEATVYIFSTGSKSCGEYLQAVEAELKARPVHSESNDMYSMDYLSFASYADGYLTRTNVTPASTAGSSTHLSGRMAWLENYCRQNPLQWYVNALGPLKRYLVEHTQ